MKPTKFSSPISSECGCCTRPFIMMYDFWGMEVTSGARSRCRSVDAQPRLDARRASPPAGGMPRFFSATRGRPDRRFGFLLPTSALRQDHVEFVGYPLSFRVQDAARPAALRRELGYGDGPLVVCSVGDRPSAVIFSIFAGTRFPFSRAVFLTCTWSSWPDRASTRKVSTLPRASNAAGWFTVLAPSGSRRPSRGSGRRDDHDRTRGVARSFSVLPIENQSEQEVTIANRSHVTARVSGCGFRRRARRIWQTPLRPTWARRRLSGNTIPRGGTGCKANSATRRSEG